MPYNAAASSGSNQGPLNPALTDAVKGRIEALRAADPGNAAPVPVDLVTASASGLDPHISVAARAVPGRRAWPRRAACHCRRCSRWSTSTPKAGCFGFLGEPRVNVLQLNLALDALAARDTGA